MNNSEDYLNVSVEDPSYNNAVLKSLLKTIKHRDVVSFKKLFLRDTDGYLLYGADCLIRACQIDGCEDIVRELLTSGVHPNGAPDSMGPIHYAALAGNVEALRVLLEDDRTDVNAVNMYGKTALHLAADAPCRSADSKEHVQCILLLLDQSNLKVNKPDRNEHTAILLALFSHNKERVQVMLRHRRHKLNLDMDKSDEWITVRETMLKTFPCLEGCMPPPLVEDINSPNPQIRLVAALQTNSLLEFYSLLHSYDVDGTSIVDPNFWYDEPYYCTCIEMACKIDGREEFISTLLQAGADPNTENRIYKKSLIHLAAETGNLAALKLLLQSDNIIINGVDCFERTALHYAAGVHVSADDEKERIKSCITLILDWQAEQPGTSNKIDVNARNAWGDTALHDAAQIGIRETLLTLLTYGGDLLIKNDQGETVLKFIESDVLKTFLNDQLKHSYGPHQEHFELVFKYEFLCPDVRHASRTRSQETNYLIPEMPPLLFISMKPELRALLNHPVIKNFLNMKWHRVRWIVYLNTFIYTFFVALVTMCILMHDYYFSHTAHGNDNITSNNHSNTKDGHSVVDDTSHYIMMIQIPLFGMLICLLIREVSQIFVSPIDYAQSLENYMEMFVIASTVYISTCPLDSKMRHHISAITVLLSWAVLVMVTGRLPALSLQLEMLKKVIGTFVKFMAWYSLVIIGFAISFYILFHPRDQFPAKTNEFFSNPLSASFKTVAMLAGEFECSSLPFDLVPVTSHVVLLIFMFLISIVLINLLSGLAVSDTRAIYNDAVILSLVSRVKMVAYIENVLLGIRRSCKLIDALLMRISTCTPFPDICLFPDTMIDKKIYMCPNVDTQIRFSRENKSDRKFNRDFVQRVVLKAAIAIIKKERNKKWKKDIPTKIGQQRAEMNKILEDLNEHQQQLINHLRDNRQRCANIEHSLEKLFTVLKYRKCSSAEN